MVPKDDSKTTQTFECKSCGIDVIYERKVVRGLALKGNRNDDKELVVYLTCGVGHTHPYTVNGA